MKKTAKLNGSSEIARSVEGSVDRYFENLDGGPPHGMHELVMGCVEKILLRKMMERTGGNQTQAAEILGLNRNTLRAKLQKHGIR